MNAKDDVSGIYVQGKAVDVDAFLAEFSVPIKNVQRRGDMHPYSRAQPIETSTVVLDIGVSPVTGGDWAVLENYLERNNATLRRLEQVAGIDSIFLVLQHRITVSSNVQGVAFEIPVKVVERCAALKFAITVFASVMPEPEGG